MIVMLPHKHELPNPFKGSYQPARLLCVCEQCGTEMAMCWTFREGYGDWVWECPSDTEKRDEAISHALELLRHSLETFKDHPEARQRDENRIQELLLTSEEYKEYFSTKTCPICHGQLEKGFFPLPAWNRLWAHVIREHFRESLTEQEVEQLFNTTISDADIEDIQCLLHKAEEGLEFRTNELCRYWIGRRYEIQKCRREKACRKVEMLAADIEMTESEKVPRKENILGSIDGLKDYIRHLLTIEREVYSVGTHLMELYMQQSNTESSIFQHKGLLAMELREQATVSKNEYTAALAAFEKVKTTTPKIVYDTTHILAPKPPDRPILQQPGLFNKKKVDAYNAELIAKHQEKREEYQRLQAKYEDDCREYKAKVREQAEELHRQQLLDAEQAVTAAKEKMEQSQVGIDEQIEAACNQPTPDVAVKALLEDEIERAEKIYGELCKCRQQLYAPDVVFTKYRNIVALATFYEYLGSGRCTSLEGANGAYNMFETECRTNEIIGQLRQVIDTLEEIKTAQYMVYTELQRVNSSLKNMNSTMNNMANSLKKVEINTNNTSDYMKAVAQNTEVIAYNTAVTAYYSKVNAELTNSLGYLIALH